MRFGEETPVEKAHRFDREPAGPSVGALRVAREELLRHAVAVVVREHVDALGAELAKQSLVQRRLVDDRIVVRARLVRPTEADHVGRDDAKARRQLRPQGMPVPRCAGEAVDRNEPRAFAAERVEDRVTAMPVRAAVATPLIERGARTGPVGGMHGAASVVHRRRLAARQAVAANAYSSSYACLPSGAMTIFIVPESPVSSPVPESGTTVMLRRGAPRFIVASC